MSAFFVTAIGTDIGKTYISAELLKAWRAKGKNVHAIKPLMSGFSESELAASDAGQLLAAMGKPVTPETVANICLHRFAPPLAPNVAMRKAGMAQDYEAILAFARAELEAAAQDTMMLVEGAGGVMSPVTDQRLHIDFVVDLGLPTILVASSYLGAVSHTLTAIEVLQARNLEIAAIVVSQPNPDDQAPEHLAHEVGLFHDLPTFCIAHGARTDMLAEAMVQTPKRVNQTSS